jgi:hypothetical protein
MLINSANAAAVDRPGIRVTALHTKKKLSPSLPRTRTEGISQTNFSVWCDYVRRRKKDVRILPSAGAGCSRSLSQDLLHKKHGCNGRARRHGALLQNPIAYFLDESERIPWIRRVMPLRPHYACLSNEFRLSSNEMYLNGGSLLQ